TTESNMQKGSPFRTPGLADETHICLVRQPIGLARITGNAGADHVFPGCKSPFIARQDVVQIQLLTIKYLAAVLTGIVIALKHVMPCELHFLLRQTIKKD